MRQTTRGVVCLHGQEACEHYMVELQCALAPWQRFRWGILFADCYAKRELVGHDLWDSMVLLRPCEPQLEWAKNSRLGDRQPTSMVGRHYATREGQLGRKATSHCLGACLYACRLANLTIGPQMHGTCCLRSLSNSIKVGLDGCNGEPQDLSSYSHVLPRRQGYLGQQSCGMILDGI